MAVHEDDESKREVEHDKANQQCNTEEKTRLTPVGKDTPNFIEKKAKHKIIFNHRNNFDFSLVEPEEKNEE